MNREKAGLNKGADDQARDTKASAFVESATDAIISSNSSNIIPT